VFVQDQHRSLVLMRSPAEQGQKVLMLGDDFWLLMPGSQRALRITPMQKLLGDASHRRHRHHELGRRLRRQRWSAKSPAANRLPSLAGT
jgi:hypothetical protein